jgi:hypothetical protein|uniref:Uncharacterized protein n=1 Tax=Myoviridae sp. ctcyQ27 TaxID=2825139 RepID=A0A8S5UFH7_9CAUD|nr:MAG TPA: hypothetical protein [Myoviridae sp. ctcyQ27]
MNVNREVIEPNQYSFIREYNDKNRPQFNPELFNRSDDAIIEVLKKVILSIERDRYFVIKVMNFSVVDDYQQIRILLREQEKFKSKNKNKQKIDDKYNYIPLKDSDIRLLIVDYYLEVPNPKEGSPRSKNLRVLIEVPKIVDKYYFRIFGNIYSSLYQVVDGSTYNNSNSANPKSQNIAFKTLFMASRIYRYIEKLKMTNGETKECIWYMSNIFKKNCPLMRYLLARFGFYQTCQLLKVNDLYISDHDIEKDDYYTVKKNNMYISLPKYIYDNDPVAQSLMYTVYNSVSRETSLNNVYTLEYWIAVLGDSYNNKTVEKGLNVLDSLESILDIPTQENLKLPEECKKNIYDIIIWILREFNELRKKDNLDISTKRIRYEEYFGAIYAIKLATGLYRISDEASKLQIDRLEKAIYTFPDFLLKQISKDSLVNYNNSVNDMDAITALKFTYKGVSGVGDGNTASIPVNYRQVHPTHLGRLDLDSSTANDPGLSGMLCPMASIHNNFFSDYKEPNNWRAEVDQVLAQYAQLEGLKNALEYQGTINGVNVEEQRLAVIQDTLSSIEKLITPIARINKEIDNIESIPNSIAVAE